MRLALAANSLDATVSSGNTTPLPSDPSVKGALGNPKTVEPVATSSYLDASRTNRLTYSVNRNLTSVSPKCDVIAEMSWKATRSI